MPSERPGGRTGLTAVVAMGTNRVIGDGRAQPWHIAEDLQRFKALTTGGVLLMGRRTWDAIGRALPGRTTVVVSRDPGFRVEHDRVRVARSVEDALRYAGEAGGRGFVAGGGEVYRLFWDRTDRLEVTVVDDEPSGDTTFPEIDPTRWRRVSSEPREGFRFDTWHRVG